MKWQTDASPNIALIKYMGKQDYDSNLPANASLSYTLSDLKTVVELESTTENSDRWEALHDKNLAYIPKLDAEEQQRFLRHLQMLKKYFNYQGNFIVRSANSFPAGCGIASSASSFAALTLCAVKALQELTGQKIQDVAVIADLSRRGSGSSCRSLFGPWVLWEGDKVKQLELPYFKLLHQVVVVSSHKKQVSSSEAHKRVKTSLLYEGRTQRAEKRLEELFTAFTHKDWSLAADIVWQEFWDMHVLFETSYPPFGYMESNSLIVLDYVRALWEAEKDGPITTMDAGPNVHLLYRQDQEEMAKKVRSDLSSQFSLL